MASDSRDTKSYLAMLQYPRQLYRYQLNRMDVSLYQVQYSSTSILLPHCEKCVLVVNRRTIDRFDLDLGRTVERLPDAPFVLSGALVVCIGDGMVALWTNCRAYRLDLSQREWQPLKSDVEKLPSVHCVLSNSRILMFYAHTIWMTNRTNHFSEGTLEGRVYDMLKGESTSFSLEIDLVGRFACAQTDEDQVLMFGGYEEMRCNGSCLLDGNRDVYALDLKTFAIQKVSKLPKALEEPNLMGLPTVSNGVIHVLSGRELVRISIPSLRSDSMLVSSLQVWNVFHLLWTAERINKRPGPPLQRLPWCLIREIALYLCAVPRS